MISRVPLPVPIGELKKANKLSLGKMYHLSEAEKELAKEVIATVIAMHDWYQSLEYRYSVLDENSDLNSHLFGLLVEHEDRLWVFTIWQKIHGNGESSFTVIPEEYDPETYLNHAKALEIAEQSCTASQ
ncbi:MAG: hypothetical protein LBJ37_16495 [Paucimonas sp.]|nr:hypothetical protein [Paucimonas sp.]